MDHKASQPFVNQPIPRKVYNLIERVSAIIYPPHCLLCGDSGHRDLDLCPACYRDLPWNEHHCPRCAVPMQPPPGGTVNSPCGQCLADPPAFEHSIAALEYNPTTGWLVSGLKFRKQLSHARLLGQLLAEQVSATASWLPDRIIPVPLHRQRLRERGYNQALEIARPVARKLGLPLDIRTAHRQRHTEAQSELKRKARQKNMRGAFSVARSLEGQSIAIVDDVVTSTATVAELAKALCEAGAERIQVWAVARAPAPK
ncbi:MAG: ComF family protein [Salinisphaeraceae bacterium]|nr:ComF family protein [Salinisphaeraceae bacterium]